MNSITERRVIHQVKIDPKISATKIAASTSNNLGRSVSAETARRALRKAGYDGRPQQFWNEVIFSDECKFNIFGSDGRLMVRRKPNTSHHTKHTTPTVKHGGGSAMISGVLRGTGGVVISRHPILPRSERGLMNLSVECYTKDKHLVIFNRYPAIKDKALTVLSKLLATVSRLVGYELKPSTAEDPALQRCPLHI
ncbi:transposable element Tcb2 transposase [Trichonephila clavipes]|nr:transposable element Tcb2 transposase [Trichonephila clavipes]